MEFLNPLTHLRAILAFCETLVKHRELTWEMTKRQLAQGYAGQAFGALWSLVHPLLLIATYLTIFTYVFRMRGEGTVPAGEAYPVYLLSGLIPWLTVSNVLAASTATIAGQANLVKQVMFPLEVLPMRVCVAALLTQSVYLALLACYVSILDGRVPGTIVLLPLLLILQTCLLFGIAFAVAAVAAFFRDLKEIIQVVCALGPYLLPIFYVPSMLPEPLRLLPEANPLTPLVYCFQDIFYARGVAHPGAWLACTGLSLLALSLGYQLFVRLRRGFGDVV